jgi:thiamine transport system permease protein
MTPPPGGLGHKPTTAFPTASRLWNKAFSATFLLGAVVSIGLVTSLGIFPAVFAGIVVSGDGFGGNSGSYLDSEVVETIFAALRFSISQAAASATAAVALALVAARAIFFCPSPLGRALLWCAQIPFGLPSLVIVFAFVLVFGNQGLLNQWVAADGEPISFIYNYWGIVHAHVYFNLGFCLRQMLLGLGRIPIQHWWGGAALGLSSGVRFRNIEWPVLRPVIINLWLIVFGLCMTSFAIVLVLGGSPAFTSLEVLIYQFVKYDLNYSAAMVAAAAQFIALASITLLTSAFSDKDSRLQTNFGTGANLNLSRVFRMGRTRLFLSHFLVLIFLIWAAVPILALWIESLGNFSKVSGDFVSRSLLPSLLTSVQVALPAALLGTTMGVTLAQVAVRGSQSGWVGGLGSKGSRFSVPMWVWQFLSIGLIALSPTLLGLFWHVTLGHAGLSPYDHAFISVISVQAIMFVPLSFRMIWIPLRIKFPNWQHTYQSLGLPLGQQALFIEWTALKGVVASVFLINFSFSMGEVAAPALFGSEHFRPLSLLLLESVAAYRFEEASAVTLVLLGVVQASYFFGSRGNHRA